MGSEMCIRDRQAVLWESATAAPGLQRWYPCWSEGCSRRTLSPIAIAEDCPHFVCSMDCYNRATTQWLEVRLDLEDMDRQMGAASGSAASHAAAMPAEPRPPVPSGLSAQARADANYYHDQLRAAKRECERALAAIQAMDREAIKAGGGPLWDLFSGPVAAQFEDVASYQECLNVICLLYTSPSPRDS